MATVLGVNQYGKAENRVVRVFRDSDPHEIVDYNVSVALWGGQDAPHLTGDNAQMRTGHIPNSGWILPSTGDSCDIARQNQTGAMI